MKFDATFFPMVFHTVFLSASLCLMFFLASTILGPVHTATASGPRQKLPQAGFRSIGIWTPATAVRMDIAVWYPTSRTMRDISLEGWVILAAKDSVPAPGRYPVIILSHGASGSRFAVHDLAAYLARNGFVVIAPTHPGDNVDNTSLFFRAANFAERPKHLKLAFDAVVASPILGPVLDTTRIGLLGVGAGAATVLQLAGAAPDLSRLDGYCPSPAPYDPLCSTWAKTFHPRMKQEFIAMSAQTGPSVFTPFIERPPSPERQPILAVGLLTPGLINLFPDQSLSAFSSPMGILTAADDNVYPPEENTLRLQELLPQRPASRILKNTTHFDLQPPCPLVYQDAFPALCGKAGPFADDARKTRNDFFARFFLKIIGGPLPALPPAPA